MNFQKRKSTPVLCIADATWGRKEVDEVSKGISWQLRNKKNKTTTISILIPTECEGCDLDCRFRREVASIGRKTVRLQVSYLPKPFSNNDHIHQLEHHISKVIQNGWIYCGRGTLNALQQNGLYASTEMISKEDESEECYFYQLFTELDHLSVRFVSVVSNSSPSYSSKQELNEFDTFVRSKLPDLPIREILGDVVSFFASEEDAGKVLTVSASTGSGKSTQIPVAILKWYQLHRKPVRITVIMPRRLTVTNVFKTVSQSEAMAGREEQVGFKIGSHHYNEYAPLVFQTVGCFVNDLIFRAKEGTKTTFPYTHVIIDEYHLQSAEMELLCGILRHELTTSKVTFRVMAMTATMTKSHLLLSKKQQSEGHLSSYLHQLSCVGRQFAVRKLSLSDLSCCVSSVAEVQESNPSALNNAADEGDHTSGQLVDAVAGRLSLIPDILKYFFESNDTIRVVLIFLPGITSIQFVEKLLSTAVDYQISVLKLHSSIKKNNSIVTCGLSSDINKRFVILSTNTAELGVTLPDVDLLIDSCLERVASHRSGLKTVLCSRDSLIQREGRVGRCKNGTAVKLLFEPELCILPNKSNSQLQQQVPESILLAALTFGSAAGVSLSELFSTVCWEGDGDNGEEQKLLLEALKELLSIGAVFKKNTNSGSTYTLSDTGVFLQMLPIDPKIGNLIAKARYLGGSELLLAIEVAVCCCFGSQQLCSSEAFIMNASNGSNSSIISSVNIIRLFRSLKFVSEDDDELFERCDDYSLLVDGCDEVLQKLSDVCSILSRCDYAVTIPTACTPLTHKEMITISALFAITFHRSLFAYIPPSVDTTTSRFNDIPVGFIKRYSLALKSNLSKHQIEDLTACGVNKVSTGSNVKKKKESARRSTLPDAPIKKETSKVDSSKNKEIKEKKVKVKTTRASYCEMEMSVVTVWDRPRGVWMMERRGLGISGTRGRLKRIFKSDGRRQPQILFDPILVPSSELQPSERSPPAIREISAPLIMTVTEFGDMVLPASVPGLLSVVLLLSEKFVDRNQERVESPDALIRNILISVEGFNGVSINTSLLTSAFPSSEFITTFESVYNSINGGVCSNNFGSLIHLLLEASHRHQTLPGFSGTQSTWRNDPLFVELFPKCFWGLH
eukprot:TRINITY_DN15783_c0_g1_i1.p1 TRINITY_DN15783_c0_g1~~TRINITY_DN15783_c0_g1_i1.p1  ORF type:complete len:1129 (+),score=216.83 TRINITY_DN15783_c0_g1_i1:51-3437(+)